MGQFTPEKISDATIIDMQAYLTSLAAPASFAMATADLPDDALPGQKLVESKKCIACHTATGPMRGFLAREETPTAAAVIAQLRTPKQHMPMYSAEVISDEEAGLVAAFLVSQMPPTTMPTTGGAGLSSLVLTLLLCGAALTLIGLAFRASRTRS
jgi:mono/diheme cytochrome c family protein